jgi:phosphoribosyl-ATP pyrophosphohydrolase
MGKRLVRDRALDSWTVPGAEHQVRPVRDAAEHRKLLANKILEEAVEVAAAETQAELTKELADLLSVMRGAAYANGVTWSDVLDSEARREAESGGFIDGMVWETPR